MKYKLKLLSGAEESHFETIVSMYKLRHKIIIKSLKWPASRKGPIRAVSGMEIDDFDIEDAYYIVHLNCSGEVDACMRLLPTDGPYLLGDVYPELISNMPVPRNNKVWEVARFVADNQQAPKCILPLLICGMLEFALQRQIQSIVSLSDIRIEKPVDAIGYPRKRLGGTVKTTTDVSAAEQFEVSKSALMTVRKYLGIDYPVLENTTIKQQHSKEVA